MPSEMKTSATERERIRRIVSMYNKYKMTFEYNLCFFELKRFYQTCTRNTKHEPKAMWTQHWMVLFHWLHCRCFIPLLLLFLLFSLPLSRSLSLSLIHSFHLNNTKLLLCNIGQRILREDYICSIPIRCLYSFLRLLLVSCFLFRFLVLSTPHPLCGVCVCMYLYILLCSIICWHSKIANTKNCSTWNKSRNILNWK